MDGWIWVLLVVSVGLVGLIFVRGMRREPEEESADRVVTENSVVQQPVVAAQMVEDTEVIAVILAAIAAELNTSSDKLVVRSFRKVSSWNDAARRGL